jgi:DNA-binding response OmpR family regulator
MLEPADADRKKILVIDRVPEQRALAESALRDHGFDVDVAQDATLGGLKLLARKPDLMVLDLGARGVESFRFIEYVREITTPPPVVFLSASRAIDSVLRGVALGAFTFLPKPVNFRALVATCRAALSRPPQGARERAGERRAHRRHAFVVAVRLAREDAAQQLSAADTPRAFARGELLDLGAGGARVVVASRLPIGARVRVMPDPLVIQAPQELLAEVRACETRGPDFSYGLQFVDLDPALADLLKEHLTPQ